MWGKFIELFFVQRKIRHPVTVRLLFPVVALGFMAASLVSLESTPVSYISISVSPATITEGEQFVITVSAVAGTPVNAVDISLKYPEDQIRVDGIDTGTSVISLWTEEPYAKSGHVYLRGGTYKRGFIGEHEIARIRGTALSTGIAQVTADQTTFVAGDGLGTNVSVSKNENGITYVHINDINGTLTGGAEVAIITDIDGNGSVDLRDISSFMAAWLTRKQTFDFNGDGRMTFTDFSILLADSFFK